jgi:phosphate transport system substrate-binding protein
MMQMIRTGVVSMLVLGLLGCGGGERQAIDAGGDGESRRASSRPITIKGSDTMVILGQRFAEDYMRQNQGTVIQVNGGGSGTGIAALINGTVDLAQSSRPMKPAEKESAEKNRGAKLIETPVALDALAVFVHGSNRVRELSIEQIASVYTGKVTNWSQLGGENRTIVIYGRENNSGTYEYFREHVLGKAAVINAVGRDVNGIGYGGIAYATDIRTVGVKAGPASPAVEPTEEHVADGTYPISRNLYFYWFEGSRPEIQQFVEWAVSPAGQAVVENVGYYPLPKSATAGDAVETATAPAQ